MMPNPNIPAHTGSDKLHPIIPPTQRFPFVDTTFILTTPSFQFLQQVYTFLVNPATHIERMPANPTGTVSATPVMMGLGDIVTITPQRTGHIVVMVSGTLSNNVGGAGADVQLRFGTGKAPAYNDPVIGTQIGTTVTYTLALAGQRVPFMVQGVAHYLSLPIWIDIALNRLVGGTASITDITITAFEL